MSHKIFRLVSRLFLVLAVLGSGFNTQIARAAGPWYVTPTGGDNNDCLSPDTPCATINGAIGKATAGDTVNVAVGTYTGTGSEVVLIDKDITISGGWDDTFTTQSGMSTIDGQGVRRGITVNSSMTTMIESFVIQNGGFSDLGFGGGILNDGTVTVNNSTIHGNSGGKSGYSGGGGGGGILNGGTMTLNNTTVSDNTILGSFYGSGILNTNFSVMIINNSTVSGNTASAAVYNEGSATITLNNSTVRGNSDNGISNQGGAVTVQNSTISANIGGIYAGGGTLTLKNSILAGNTAADCTGTIVSSGYNLIGDTTNCDFTPGNGDLTNVDPLLGPLQDNGGPTFTHALLSGSPAIDAGNPAVPGSGGNACLATDQRGVARPQGAHCDIGAFELEADGGGGGEVTIDIKPGNKHNRIMIGSRGNASVQVAILSTPDFDAPRQVDKNSLTFGATGNENSLRLRFLIGTPDCRARDVNHDRLKDLVCSFLIGKTGFKLGDTIGILKGQTVDGTLLEGRDSVVITAPSYPSYPSYP